MRKFKKYPLFLTLLSALVCAACFAACAKPIGPSQYTVAFESNGGSAVASVTRNAGTQIAKPTDPARDGYEFAGWFFDSDLQNPVTFPLTLDKDYTLYAKWNGNGPGGFVLLTVTFMTNGAEKEIAPVSVEQHGKIEKPADPQKTGYTFGGWYAHATDFSEANRWDFANSAVTGDMTLYAKWTAAQYAVTFNANGGEGVPASVQAVFGAAMPTITVKPTRPLHAFLGFFDAATGGTKYYNGNLASAKNWDKTAAATLYAQWEEWKTDGDGTQENPVNLYTAEHLTSFAGQVNAGNTFAGKYIELRTDIDLEGMKWTPIGVDTRNFAGNFNGNGFEVSDFEITFKYLYAGLFGNNTGEIENLGVKNFSIDIANAYDSSTALPGILYSNRCYAGGLAGYNDGGTVQNCYASGSVTSTANVSAGAYAGGLVGGNFNGGRIIKSYATGDVAAIGYTSSYAGGLVGRNENASIQNCYATGSVISSVAGPPYDYGGMNNYGGGFVGYYIGTGSITYCYATGNVYAANNRVNTSGTASVYVYAGGFAGMVYSGAVVTGCYATGNVSAEVISIVAIASAYAGGIAGAIYNGGVTTMTNCYRYEGQQFSRKSSSSESALPSNTLSNGACTLANLNSASFYTTTLGWSNVVWDFSVLDFESGKFPTLK